MGISPGDPRADMSSAFPDRGLIDLDAPVDNGASQSLVASSLSLSRSGADNNIFEADATAKLRDSRQSPNSARPAGAITITAVAATHTGYRRSCNEDSLVCADSVYFVCDGMGGHEHGDYASRILAQSLQNLTGSSVLTRADIEEAICAASSQIAQLPSKGGRPGTTVSGFSPVWDDQGVSYLVANIGDSRTYLLRNNQLRQLSHDHSLVQELIDAGVLTLEQARISPKRSIITRAVGAGNCDQVETDFFVVPACPGDRLLVCTDGLSGEIADPQIEQILLDHRQTQVCVEALISASLLSGGRDNISVIVADIGPG